MDARKAIAMFTKVNVRTIGVVENMSGFICPDCGSEHDIFGSGGGSTIARAGAGGARPHPDRAGRTSRRRRRRADHLAQHPASDDSAAARPCASWRARWQVASA